MHISAGLSRRRLLAAATAGGATAMMPSSGRAAAVDSLTVALIGCGSQGRSVARAMAQVPGVTLAAACDPDESRLEKLREELGVDRGETDLRRILDDRSIDAVIVATPDHWHAPASILACEAGKHVYVEKPCSHNFREATLLLDAARRTSVVVQHGTQSRSNPLIAEAVAMLRDGVVGDLLVAKAWNVQRRKSIGHHEPSAPPPGVDYDLWVGPAPLVPFQQNRFHYNWRWWHAFGCGDVGNNGTHELDCARWGLGIDALPARIAGVGGKYAFDDDQEFPDTATLVFEYPDDGRAGKRRQIVFEMRLWSGNYPHNCDSGVEFHGTDGMLFVSKRGKLELLDGRNKRVEITPRSEPLPSGSHQADFVAAIREGRRPRADIEEAVRSVALVHLGNIAVRLQRSLQFDPATGRITGDEEANDLLGRTYRPGHWAVPGRS
jgi:predicted dehydrogenase